MNVRIGMIMSCLAAAGVGTVAAAVPAGVGPVAHWRFEEADGATLAETTGGHPGIRHGSPQAVAGAVGRALLLDGQRDYVQIADAEGLRFTDATFSVTAWVNVHALGRDQQMIIAKNVYSADQREWGLMVDRDQRFRFYLWHDGWQTIGSKTRPTPGQWTHLAVTVDAGQGRLYVNGRLESEGDLGPRVPATAAPLTIGGVDNGGQLMQMFKGAVDEVQLFDHVIKPEEIRTMADQETTPHDVPPPPEPYSLWSGADLPTSAEIPLLEGVRFSLIKPYQPEVDGGRWLLGVALAWHRGRLYAAYGANPSPHENTATEEAHCRISDDDGRTWGEVVVMDAGEGNLGVSHGVFLPHAGRLWAFQGAFYDSFQRTHTRAYLLDDASGRWEAKGVVVGDGFWPMQEPLKMTDGNWIMSGARVDKGYPFRGNYPAVAISHGDDLTRWDLVVITPQAGVENVWGESTVFLAGDRIINVSRWGGEARALLAVSEDCGRTWTESMPTNLAMNTSKPYTGTLSTGEHYLVGATTADVGGRRDIVTIALTRPGETTFSRVFAIRHAVCPEGRGTSNPKASLSYPYAVEQGGKLYVGYADKDRPSAELAVIPVSSLAPPAADAPRPMVNRLAAPPLLPPGWDPVRAGATVMRRLVNTSAPQVKGAHDAEFVGVGDRAYIVAEANDVKGGESADWPFIYATLSIVSLRTLELEKVIDFAKGEQAFANETLPAGACFVPRILRKDARTLRCYFTSEAPGKRQSQMWYRDFDLARGEFTATIHRAKLKTAAGTFDFQPRYFHADAAAQGFAKRPCDHSFFLFDSFKRFDGKLYVAINNFNGKQNALALVHDDLATFEVLGHYNEPQTEQLSESAVNRLPDGTWMAICRNDRGNYHVTTSADGKAWSVGKEVPQVPNGANSKPTFDRFAGVYYLGWQEATRIQGVSRSVFNVDISRDGRTWERKYRFETPQSFQYPTFHEHEDTIWLCVTQGDTDASRKERIMFGVLERPVGSVSP